MKNLPDKIYLNLSNLTEEEYNELDFNELSEVTWSEDDVQGTNIEYVRKDAFIEKACEFISKHIESDKYVFADEESYRAGCPYNYFETIIFIEDFKKYMEE